MNELHHTEEVNPSTGVNTGIAGAVINLCFQTTFLFIPIVNFFALLNAFPTIALAFAIVAAVNSKRPEKRQLSLRFANRAHSMNIGGMIFNIISFFVGLLALLAVCD